MSGWGLIPPLTSAPSTSKNFPLKSNGGCSHVPRSTDRNSSVLAYRVGLGVGVAEPGLLAWARRR